MGKKAATAKRPKIVTIGGGTGHFALLSGLKTYDVDITAIVTMSDNGGSTGVLRDELGVLPPGDLRQCLVALSEADEVLRKLFTHRFAKGTLKGHTFGNLFISTLEQVTGSIEHALEESRKLLSIRGSVLPVTLKKAQLEMVLNNGKVLTGEHSVSSYLLVSKFGIKSMRLRPQATLNPRAREAIAGCDLVVIGPGNLYSSLVPNFLVPGLAKELAKARAHKVYVANLMNRFGHTDGFTCETYVDELERFGGARCIDTILYNKTQIPESLIKKYVDEGEPVHCGPNTGTRKQVGADLLSPELYEPKQGDPLRRTLIRHDPKKLARALMKEIGKRTKG